MAPYFEKKQKLSAVMVIDGDHPAAVIVYSAWKIGRAFWLSVTLPKFEFVQKDVFRAYESGLKQMINHICESLQTGRGAGGGVSGVIVEQDHWDIVIRIFPRSDRWKTSINKDGFGAVTLSAPAMRFGDVASLNQVKHVLGEMVQLAEAMEKQKDE